MDSSSTSSVEMRPSMPTLVGIPMGMPVYNNNNYTSEMVGGAMAGMSNRNANSEIGSKRKKGGNSASTPYIPSYMDLTNGPEPCVVCADAATGYHYRCMTCEGCKGFFRRTIQKNLKYHCKWSGQCVIDKNTRNQCQQCRFNKCISVGMATDLVLNEKQRIAKRKLIEENRERRKRDIEVVKVNNSHPDIPQVPLAIGISGRGVLKRPSMSPSESVCSMQSTSSSPASSLKEVDHYLINAIVQAFEKSSVRNKDSTSPPLPFDSEDGNSSRMWQQLAEVITPSIIKVVDFAKNVPGFETIDLNDRVLLLRSCCMEIMCLRAACRYNNSERSLTLSNGVKLYQDQLQEISHHGISLLLAPIFEFAKSISKLNLDRNEVALLAALLLMQTDRTGLQNPDAIERLQDPIIGAFSRYVCEQPGPSLSRWGTILIKVTDLRTISTRHAERVLAVKLDKPTEIPAFVAEIFDEGDNNQMLMSSLSPSEEMPPLLTPSVLKPSSTSVCSSFPYQTSAAPSEHPDITSPLLRTPNLIAPVAPFWSNNSLGLGSVPPTPKLSFTFNNIIEEQSDENYVSSSMPNLPAHPPDSS